MYTKNQRRRVIGVNGWRLAERVSRWLAVGASVGSFGYWLFYPTCAVERRHGITLPPSSIVLKHWEEYPEAWGEAEIVMDAGDLPQLITQLKPSSNASVVKMAGIAPGEWQKAENGNHTYACDSRDGDYMVVSVQAARNGKATVHIATGD